MTTLVAFVALTAKVFGYPVYPGYLPLSVLVPLLVLSTIKRKKIKIPTSDEVAAIIIGFFRHLRGSCG